MSAQEVLQNLIARHGQSQGERAAVELDEHFVDVDEHTREQRLLFAKSLAKLIKFHPRAGGPSTDWTPFFASITDAASAQALLGSESGEVTPHLALFAAFVQLFEQPRRVQNSFTARHLDFHFRRVLGFTARAALPDRAHVIASLKKNAAPVRVLPSHALSAGKDATGVELVYRPVRETLVVPAAIERLQSIFVDESGFGVVRAAPVAPSLDGAGAPLLPSDLSWPPFGDASYDGGQLGFALSSSVLRMREGQRKIRVAFTLASGGLAGISAPALAAAFSAFVSGETGWLGPFDTTASIAGTQLTLELTVPSTEKSAVSNYDIEIHGYAFSANAPLIQFHLNQGGAVGYRELRSLVVRRVSITVEVTGVTSLALESEAGSIDPKKTFLPFGPQPAKGDRFFVGDSETLSKRLQAIALQVRWHGLPNFTTRYAGYGNGTQASSFTATATYQDATGAPHPSTGLQLFGSGADTNIDLTPGVSRPVAPATRGQRIAALHRAGSELTRQRAEGLARRYPVYRAYSLQSPEPDERSGFITLTLEQGFLSDVYRKKTIENVLAYSKQASATPAPVVLQEPYAPAIEHIELSYKATSDDVDLEATSVAAFASQNLAFFHVDCFGPRREHGYLRAQYDFVSDKRVSLLPTHSEAGELFVGISGVGAGDNISLLLQVSEGSGDPEIDWPEVRWSVLCDNYFRMLGPGELVLDTTNALRTSGLVVIHIPNQATTTNTVLSPGYLWLRASAASSASGVSRLLAVMANALEVTFEDHGNDPGHFAAPLIKGSIKQLKTPIAGISAVDQPFASFAGSAAETPAALYTRAAERLRHKGRAVSAWDYERLVLQCFPSVDHVKCIPHAKPNDWLAPGHVLIIVVPSLRDQHAVDPLKPKVDADTLARIQTQLQARAAMNAEVHVKNPFYQPVRLDFKVKFRSGFPFKFYRSVLDQEIITFLSPWAFDPTQAVTFVSQLYRSTLLDFVERRDYVDYVVDFKLTMPSTSSALVPDINEAKPATPDTILVSAHDHAIAEII